MDGSLNEGPAESQSEQALGAFLTKLQSRLAMALLGDELLRVADGNSGTGSDMLASATYFTTACIIAAGEYPEWAQAIAVLAADASREMRSDAVQRLAERLVRDLSIEVRS